MLQLHPYAVYLAQQTESVNAITRPLFSPFLSVFLFSNLSNTLPDLMESNGCLAIIQVKPPTWNVKKPMKMIFLQFAKLENLCKLIQWGLLTTLTNSVSTRILLLIVNTECSNHIVICMYRFYTLLLFLFLIHTHTHIYLRELRIKNSEHIFILEPQEAPEYFRMICSKILPVFSVPSPHQPNKKELMVSSEKPKAMKECFESR